MPFIYDLIDPQLLVGFVRGLTFDQFTLERHLPNLEVDDIEYRIRSADLQDQEVAPYRAFDAESAIGGRQGLTEIRGTIPPLSKKVRLGEEERLRMRALESGLNDAIIDAIYDDAENMTRAVQARIELARGQALYDGKVVINENQVGVTADFGFPASHRVAPVPLWSDPLATVIQDLTAWVELYVDDNGFAPAEFQTSTRVIGFLLRNDEIRDLFTGPVGGPALVTRAALNSTLEAFGLPPITTYDTKVVVNGVEQRVIPDDRLLLLPPAEAKLGRTFYGITAEALELVSEGMLVSRDAPGIVAVLEKTFNPVSTWTNAAGISLPVLGNGDAIITADVL